MKLQPCPPPTELQQLTRRFDRLQRTNRILGATLIALCLGVFIAANQAGEQESDDSIQAVIRARKFQLLDKDNRVRAELAIVDENSAGLFLKDELGRMRGSLTHDDEQTALFLRDAEETIRLGAAQFAHGGGGYALHGEKSKGAAVLYFKNTGSLRFFDDEGTVTHQLPAK